MGIIRGIAFAQPIVSTLPEGLRLSRNTGNTLLIDIQPGRVVIGAGANRTTAISGTVIQKRLISDWSQINTGGRFVGEPTPAPFQTWHVYLIRNLSSGDINAGFSTSVAPTTFPSGWDGRMIGSILLDGAGDIRDFSQLGNRFFLTTTDLNTANLSTSTSNLVTLSVPSGIPVRANVLITVAGTTGQFVSLSGQASMGVVTGANLRFEPPDLYTTAASRQINLFANSANINVVVYTFGWEHPMGVLW